MAETDKNEILEEIVEAEELPVDVEGEALENRS